MQVHPRRAFSARGLAKWLKTDRMLFVALILVMRMPCRAATLADGDRLILAAHECRSIESAGSRHVSKLPASSRVVAIVGRRIDRVRNFL
jgi:hypothetical protein